MTQQKDLPYMTSQELEDFIDSTDIELSKEEIEYLYLRRRRLSLSMKKPSNANATKVEKHPILSEYPCQNSYPYKVLILGDESYSGKIDIFQLFTLTDLIESAPHILDMKQLPPCDIQTKVLEAVDAKDSSIKKHYALELWLPQCTEETTALRPLYYPATDIFILIFSIKEPETFNYLAKMILPELKKYINEATGGISNADTPILLVGNHAEVRNDETYEGQLVPSQEAFNLAQENGISKYIEIFSENLFHIHEIFQQSVLVVDSAHAASKTAEKERALNFYKEYQFFKSQLTVPAPDCNFSQLEKTFELSTNPGVEYFFTTDGTDPTKASKRYKGPIQLKKPCPKEIRAIAIARCKYQSEVSIFKVPAQSSAPVGYFDPITKGFHIQRKSDTVYFITLDGSDPTTDSMVYKPPGIFFDNKRINCAFEKTPNIPEVVKVIAIEEGKFGSRIVAFKPFNVLPTPSATLKDNVLRIDTIPGVVYRYTIDGSTPTFDSAEFNHSEGVLISSEREINNVKIAAFPKLFFPSAVKLVKNQKTRSPKPTKQIRMNRATMRRNESSPMRPSSNGAGSNGGNVSGMSGGGGSHYASSTISSANRKRSPSKLNRQNSSGALSSGSRSPRPSSPRMRNAVSPIVRPQRGLKSSITQKEQQSLINRKALFQQMSPRVHESPVQHKSHQFKVNTAFSTSSSNTTESLVKCKAEGTNIEFKFEKPVLLSNVIVKTPGQGDGPSAYECFSIDEDSAEITTIASGHLKDVYGEQVMEIDSTFTQIPCTKVLCVFQMQPGQTAFKILDMKVDCKVV
mmetsp:Transcript_5718/g.21639  ORF Transcript_5718/g.21639 Transcript_5718/m.21639 type:complete len:800 (-) Transcript_5718:1685-4084(-)